MLIDRHELVRDFKEVQKAAIEYSEVRGRQKPSTVGFMMLTIAILIEVVDGVSVAPFEMSDVFSMTLIIGSFVFLALGVAAEMFIYVRTLDEFTEERGRLYEREKALDQKTEDHRLHSDF